MTTEVKYDYLRNHPLFVNISEEKITEAASLMKVKTVYRGEIMSFGDVELSKIYLLISGKVKIAEFGFGNAEIIKDIMTAPDIFGNLSMDHLQSKNVYAEALTANVVVSVFNAWDFKTILQDNATMMITYANIITGKLSRLEYRHSDLFFSDTKSRLIHFIKYWAQTDGSKVGDKIVLNNYLTHADIANAIAASRQTVSTLFNELRDAGLLFYNRKQIELSQSFHLN